MPKVSPPPPTSIPKEVQKDMSLRFSGLLGKGLGKRKRRKGKGKGERGREKDKRKTQGFKFPRKGGPLEKWPAFKKEKVLVYLIQINKYGFPPSKANRIKTIGFSKGPGSHP